MNRYVAVLAILLLLPAWTGATEGDWKQGRLYYRAVCSACHTSPAGGGKAINPSDMTKAEWSAYLGADKHAAGGKADPKVSAYLTQNYRASIAGSNKVAAKFASLGDAELAAHLQAFVIHGAKDSDTPSRCQ